MAQTETNNRFSYARLWAAASESAAAREVGVAAAWVAAVLGSGVLAGWSIRVAAFANELGLAMVVTALLASAGLAFRWIASPADRSSFRRKEWLRFAIPSLVLLIAFGVFFPAGTATVFLVSAVMLGVEAASWSWALQLGKTKPSGVSLSIAAEEDQPATANKAPRSKQRSSTPLVEEPLIEPGVLQQITRLREEGREVVRGVARAEFQSGQKKQTVHLSFCPPLPAKPELFVETIDGPEARIQTAELQTFGARLEITLPVAPHSNEAVLVEFYAAANAG